MLLTEALAKWRVLASQDRRLLYETVYWLCVMRLAILLVPVQRLCRWFRVQQHDAQMLLDAPQHETARRIGWAIRAAAPRTFWQSACLVQALSGMAMLRRRNIPGVFYLGVARDHATGAVISHAWLCAGNQVLTGAPGHARYAPLIAFSWGNTQWS